MTLCLHGVDATDVMADVYFRPDYASLHADGAEVETVSEPDFVHGAVVRSIPGTAYHDLETPWGYGSPLATSTGALARGIAAWRAGQSGRGRVAEFIRLHPFINPMALQGLVDDLRFNRATVLVDLRKDADQRMKETDRTARRRLRVARRELTVRRLGGDEWPIFKQCYESGLGGNQAAARYYFSDDFYRRLMAAEYTATWVAERSGRPLAVGCFMSSGIFAHTHLSGGDDAARKYHAAYLIHAEAIEHYAASGCHWMHMGGGRTPDPADPLLAFKRKFSPLRAAYYTAGLVFDRAAYDALGGARGGLFQGYRFPHAEVDRPGAVTVREADPADFPAFYALRCDPHNIAWTGFAVPPDWLDLKAWFGRNCGGQGRRIYLAESGGRVIGYAYAVDHGDRIETAVGTDSRAGVKHAGRTIIKAVAERLPADDGRPVEAWIFPENAPSVKAHEAAGYRRDRDRPPREVPAALAETAGMQACWTWRPHA